jgi:GH15 family glucan-1,4-alpha-glucosidase
MQQISDYAIIGDGRSAALVSRLGSIDWLCWPRFDSPALFAALLDDRAGRWLLGPGRGPPGIRRYLPGTNVLETRFETATGVLVVTDFMPVADEADKRTALLPEHEIVRLASCLSGEVELVLELDPRPAFGLGRARLRPAGAHGLRIETAAGLLVLRSDLPLAVTPAAAATGAGEIIRGRALLRAGQTAEASLTFAPAEPAVLPPIGSRSREVLSRSVAWWRRWVGRMRYDGPQRAAVERSVLCTKLLVFAPSGAIIAAPTTSLPERLGGDLNWDYRFCWLRDAAFTVRALFGLGFSDEAEAFVNWLLHSTRLTRPKLQTLYDVFGRVGPASRERTLSHLSGHRGSQPVRVGNAAADQLQLDVYGEVIDATLQLARAGTILDRETRALLAGLGDVVCRAWRQPDHGIWEPRVAPQHHTHSRVLCWVALDRLLELDRLGQLPSGRAGRYAEERARIRADVEEHAYHPGLGSYTAVLGGTEVDASLLQLGWYGFEPPRSPRMRGTYARILADLGAGGPLVYRYRDGTSPGEGAFGACSFWAAEHLAAGGGAPDEAERVFASLVRFGNDVGLFGEEIDPASGEALGNFPQGLTHVGLLNAALTLAESRRNTRRPAGRPASEPEPAPVPASVAEVPA